MTISTFTRMGSGLLVFIILARYLGPEPFGIIATSIAYSSLLIIISDFGLGTYALRLAGAEPENAANIVAKAILTKIAVTVPVAVFAMVALFLLVKGGTACVVYTVIFVGLFFASIADLGFAASRANSRYDFETYVVIITSFLGLIFVGLVAFLTHSVFWCALAFASSRIVYFAGAILALMHWVQSANWSDRTWRGLAHELRQSSSYALDSIVTNLSSQADVIMISLMLSHAQTGIYQAGSRLVQGISPFAVILSTVYLPRLSAAHRKGDVSSIERLSRQLNIEMLIIGIMGFLIFLIVGPIWTKYIYGPRYHELVDLWPGFAAFVLLRFIAAAYGIQLAALGEIRTRIGAQFLAVIVVIILSLVIVPSSDLPIVSWIIAIASLLPLILYGWRSMALVGNKTTTVVTLIISSAVVFGLLFYIICKFPLKLV